MNQQEFSKELERQSAAVKVLFDKFVTDCDLANLSSAAVCMHLQLVLANIYNMQLGVLTAERRNSDD